MRRLPLHVNREGEAWRGKLRLARSMAWALSFVLASSAHAVSVGERSDDPSPEAQKASFEVHEDFEVHLFADESLGIANPVAMHWDHRGRLWVLTTLTYAQLEPGETPNDTLVILEDTDEDGRADESTVFADGLDMPMGFALGHGGVFLGEGPDLVFLEDTDGDDRADRREVLLTGFGTGDTHQNISNFTWGPDGYLYFCQGLHCHSRVETPWGIVRGDKAGFWRFNPETLRLHPYCFPSLASQNPCGIAFDSTGAMFLKSNNRELIYVTPGRIPTTHQNNLAPVASIGATPGKSMGGEFVSSEHLPDWIQDHILIAGYYAHRVSAFPLQEEGAGYARVEPVEILSAGHVSFRPVEIRIGPDGAIYVADWFNPIIGHYQASLRHPDRDEQHGRIWRLTAKGRELTDRDEWDRPETVPVEPPPSRSEIVKLVASEDPRDRLEGVVAAANRGGAESMALALEALDRPTDRFIDYALEQTVHALAGEWAPAVRKGEFSFREPGHLAYALETLGGDEGREIAREQLASEGLSDAVRSQLQVVLAATGTPADLRALLESDGDDVAILRAIGEAWTRREVRPAGGGIDRLRSLLGHPDGAVRGEAIRLAGLWGAKPLSGVIREILADPGNHVALRGEAARALGRIEGETAVATLRKAFERGDPGLRPAVTEALVSVTPRRASRIVAPVLAGAEGAEAAAPLLAPFFGRKQAPERLAGALREIDLSAEAAGHLATAMSRMGRKDEAVLGVLHDAMGLASGARAYSPEFVDALVAEVREAGDAEAGREIYHRPELTCVACHQIDGAGGVIGPALDAVGAGLPPDLLVESVFWPDRQLKEGYFAIEVTTKGGETYSGYREKEQDGVLHLRDTATGEVKAIPRREIANVEQVGSLMPPGLTKGLSREELRDLVAFLASLKG